MSSKSTILIVDDNRNWRHLVKNLLSDLGYTYLVATTGEEALEQIQNKALDLIILDLKLPNSTGIEIIRRATDAQLDLAPVIIMTGYPSIDTAVEAGRLSVFDYIQKGSLRFEEELKESVSRAISLKSGDREDDTEAIAQKFFRRAAFNIKTVEDGLVVSGARSPEWREDNRIFVKCIKSGNATKEDVRATAHMVRKFSGQEGIGFLAHPEELAQGAASQIWLEKKDGVFIIPLYVPAMRQLMNTKDREECHRHLVNLKRTWHALTDPYESLNATADPQWFFGQDDLIKQIGSHLDSNSKKHIAIHGMRKSGKTALLNQVELLSRAKGMPTARWIAKKGEGFQAVLYNLVSDLMSSLNELYENIELPSQESLQEYQANPKGSFKNDLQQLRQATRSLPRDIYRLVLLIDELDINNFFPWQGDRREDYEQYCNLFQTLKEVTEVPDQPPLSLVVACEYFWVDEVNRFPHNQQFQNPMYGRFLRLPLTFLSEAETAQLVCMLGELAGLEYTPESINRIYSETRGHPQITRWLCSCIWRMRENGTFAGNVTLEMVDKAVDYFLYELGGERYRNYFEQIFWIDPLSPDINTDQRVLAELALRHVYQIEDLLLNLCHTDDQRGAQERDEVSAAISRLRSLGIVEEIIERQSLRLTIPLYRRWIRSEKLGIIESAGGLPHATAP